MAGHMDDPRQEELNELLDDLSYEMTSARSTGLGEPEALRASARRIRDISSNIDSLAGSVVAERMADQG